MGNGLKNPIPKKPVFCNNHVFILGAGFSKAISSEYPTLKELSNSIEKRYNQLVQDTSGYFDKATTYIAEYYFSLPKGIRNNFEHLLTYLHSNFPWKTSVEQNLDKALYHDVLRLLLKELEHLHLPQDFNKKCLDLGAFINTTNATCLTFNYDLLLENILSQTSVNKENNNISSQLIDDEYKHYYKMNLESFDINNYLTNESANHVSIHKLHGSVNWIYKSNSIPDKLMFNAKTNNYSVPEGYSPYIVPPVTDKTSFYNNPYLTQLWYNAKETLHTSSNIYIIGYSFPKTDLSSEFLMKFALQKTCYNENLKRKIYVVNLKENSAIKNLCRDSNVELIQITCKECPYYKTAGTAMQCKRCKHTPLDKFINSVITKELNEFKEVGYAK